MGGRPLREHGEILSYEEILAVVEAAVDIGISKIRITGGEPLVRRKVLTFCRMLAAIKGIESVAITTNGILLADMAYDLADAGIARINISLDTMKPDRFQKITGINGLQKVLAGIDKAEAAGLSPIKINTVVMRGINDDEIEDFVRLAIQKPYQIRFIELMPTDGWASDEHRNLFMAESEIIERVQQIGVLESARADAHFGPAKVYSLPEAKGKIGFIAPLSHHFCDQCNRLRLTADGRIKPCLFSNHEIDLKNALRAGASKARLMEILKTAVNKKPRGHKLAEGQLQNAVGRGMRAIGG